MDTFAFLLRSCISDAKESRRTREALEGAGLLLLGVVCSVATSYIAAALGVV
jgi:hypothetical protein